MDDQSSHMPFSVSEQAQSPPLPLLGKTALVTGVSRGIGASVTKRFGYLGADIAINYRSKGPRAREVADQLVAMGRKALSIQGDIVSAVDIAATFNQIRTEWGRLDFLIVNASRRLEQNKVADYAMQLNRTAQVNVVNGALNLM